MNLNGNFQTVRPKIFWCSLLTEHLRNNVKQSSIEILGKSIQCGFFGLLAVAISLIRSCRLSSQLIRTHHHYQSKLPPDWDQVAFPSCLAIYSMFTTSVLRLDGTDPAITGVLINKDHDMKRSTLWHYTELSLNICMDHVNSIGAEGTIIIEIRARFVFLWIHALQILVFWETSASIWSTGPLRIMKHISYTCILVVTRDTNSCFGAVPIERWIFKVLKTFEKYTSFLLATHEHLSFSYSQWNIFFRQT